MAAEGYPQEEHYVTTPDGYILKVFRIPGSPKDPARPGKKVVFIQHGLLCSSADWVVLGKDKAIPYLLADAGYDVWPFRPFVVNMQNYLIMVRYGWATQEATHIRGNINTCHRMAKTSGTSRGTT